MMMREREAKVWRSGPVERPWVWVTPDRRAAELYAEGMSYNGSSDPPRSYVVDLDDAVVVDGRRLEDLAAWVRGLPVWGATDAAERKGRRWLEHLAEGVEAGEIAPHDVPERLEMAGPVAEWCVDLPERLVLVIEDLAGELEHESWWVDEKLLRGCE